MGKSKQLVLIVGIIILVAGGIVGGRYLIQQRFNQQRPVIVPRLSSEATAGEAIFLANCAVCHGKNAAGTDKGPPLVSQIYSPAHHSDFSFVRAVTVGVPQHHWLFGPMPAQPQLGQKQIDQIVAYIPELQKANGMNERE
jgi:mono/diheme cytochrome c family protein